MASTRFDWLLQNQSVFPILIVVLLLAVMAFVVGRLVLRYCGRSDAERTYRYAAGRYGIAYDSLSVGCTINDDGSARIRRTVAVEAYSMIETLDTYLLIPEAPEQSGAAPIGFEQVHSLTPARNVSLVGSKQKDAFKQLSALIAISPPLHKGERVAYEMTERVPPGAFAVGLTRAALAERETTYDYFGWNINRPTRHLTLRVYFPDGTGPQVYSAEVRYASASGFPSERLQYEEQKRLRGQISLTAEGNYQVLHLEVAYPMTGLIYILRWQPLTADGEAEGGESVAVGQRPSPVERLTYLRTLLTERFSESELRTLCFDLGIDYAILPGRDKGSKAQELVGYLDRRNLLPELVRIGRQQRPDIPWDGSVEPE